MKCSLVGFQCLRVLSCFVTVRAVVFKAQMCLNVSFYFALVRVALSTIVTRPLSLAHLVCRFRHILDQKLFKF